MQWQGASVGVVLVLAACAGGGSSTVGGTGGGSSSGGSSSGGPVAPTEVGPAGPPPGDVEIEVPFVACALTEVDADGGLVDGDSPHPPDGGDPEASACEEVPPPECIRPTIMIAYLPGPCDGQRCQFDFVTTTCPGGCFRQADGGTRCNE